MKYCKNVSTLEELRKQYKELLKKHHPDNANGSTETTFQSSHFHSGVHPPVAT